MKSQKKQNLAILVSESISQDGKLIDLARTFDSEVSMQEFYDSFGYVTIKNAIPIDLLSEIQHDLECIFRPFATDERYPVDSAIVELDKNDKARLYEISTAASKLNSIKAVGVHLNQLFPKFTNNKNPVLEIESCFMLSIPNDKRLVINFHQESNYIRDFADIINIHFPIFRTSNIENGTMSLIPSSHSNGTLTFEKKRFSDDSYTDLIPSKIDEITSELPELHCQLDLGDCVFFHKDLIHKSNPNNSKLCRPVCVSRFTQSLTGDWAHRISADL
jgi:hypothetical protein